MFYANPIIVKSYLKEFNQQITKYKQLLFNIVGISETIRIYKIYQNLPPINYWGWGLCEALLFYSKALLKKNLLYIKNSIIHYKNILIYKFMIPSIIENLSNKDDHIKFNQWLAGLIDGDGYLRVSKQGYTSCEITVGLEDEKMLIQIQNKFGGSPPHQWGNLLRLS